MRNHPIALAAALLTVPTFAQEARKAAAPAQLPVTRVALYKNGVGFFEHAGHVTGDQSVTIDFTSAQLNDVLQSLTAIDFNGGRIAGADYNSTTPLDQQLKALALGLPEKTTFSGLFTALRGTRVQVTGSGTPFTGRLVAEEMQKTGSGKDQAGMLEGRFLTVAADSGEVRIFQLTPSLSVRLLDTAAHTDLTQYLQVLDANRNSGLRQLTLQDNGTGLRELHVSYISEVPIWKSTYRILFTDAPHSAQTQTQTATLQGWSVVDNTTGEDWTNVHLSLIAGAPQSFIQPLSIPYYSRRPEVPLPQEAQLTPQTHESGDQAVVANPKVATGVGFGAGLGGSIGSGVLRGMGAAPAPVPQSALSMNIDGLTTDTEAAASDSLLPNTTTNAFDDFFAYNLTEPITIHKNESALVPILQTKIQAERVTLWSPEGSTPLRALWITNTSNLTLDRGSFTLVENGSFGGEGLLDPIHPNEKRLLSYAADQAVRVTADQAPQQHRLRSLTIAKGVLIERYRDYVEQDYTIRNAAPDARTVVIEHPRNGDFNLHADSKETLAADERKPDEITPAAYRFRVPVEPGQTAHLKVVETHAYPTQIQLGYLNDLQVRILLQQTGDDPGLLQQLQPLLDIQHHISDLDRQKKTVDDRLKGLNDEEKRQRENIVALKDTDKLAQKRFVDQLSQIEDQILQQQKQQESLAAQIAAAQQALADKAPTLQFEQTLIP